MKQMLAELLEVKKQAASRVHMGLPLRTPPYPTLSPGKLQQSGRKNSTLRSDFQHHSLV